MGTRCFLALAIPPEAHEELGGVISRLRMTQADVAWVRPENLHLTLKFFGTLPSESVEAVKKGLSGLAGNAMPFWLRLGGLGVFPGVSRPKVLWVGVQEGQTALAMLAQKSDVLSVLPAAGKNTKPFSAHLTLGRVRSGKNLKELVESVSSVLFISEKRFIVERLIFYESVLSREGSVYRVISEAPLGSGEGVS